ncbi:unnamed protein product [Dovyalis caffra]|uniref:Uncharacterized protein n=1 Tax=Dovyalis caffra TaxID=77055 RepID=A0AAV1RSV2_9ROSI|nr:unnamed protein product [Dovyalis caffra]
MESGLERGRVRLRVAKAFKGKIGEVYGETEELVDGVSKESVNWACGKGNRWRMALVVKFISTMGFGGGKAEALKTPRLAKEGILAYRRS